MILLWRTLVISRMFLLLIMEWLATGKARLRVPERRAQSLHLGEARFFSLHAAKLVTC